MSEKQAKYKTGAEKEICESEKDYPDLSEAGKEYIEIIKSDKLQLWDENKKLKEALSKAIDIISMDHCPPDIDGRDDSDKAWRDCEIKSCEKCWMEYLLDERRD